MRDAACNLRPCSRPLPGPAKSGHQGEAVLKRALGPAGASVTMPACRSQQGSRDRSDRAEGGQREDQPTRGAAGVGGAEEDPYQIDEAVRDALEQSRQRTYGARAPGLPFSQASIGRSPFF
jgi:hypothetical protein